MPDPRMPDPRMPDSRTSDPRNSDPRQPEGALAHYNPAPAQPSPVTPPGWTPPTLWARLCRRWTGRTRYALAGAAVVGVAQALAGYFAPADLHQARASLRFLPLTGPASPGGSPDRPTSDIDAAIQAQHQTLREALPPEQSARQANPFARLAARLGAYLDLAPAPNATALRPTPTSLELRIRARTPEAAIDQARATLARYTAADPLARAHALAQAAQDRREAVSALEAEFDQQTAHLANLRSPGSSSAPGSSPASASPSDPARAQQQARARIDVLTQRLRDLRDARPALRAAALHPDHPEAPSALRALAVQDPSVQRALDQHRRAAAALEAFSKSAAPMTPREPGSVSPVSSNRPSRAAAPAPARLLAELFPSYSQELQQQAVRVRAALSDALAAQQAEFQAELDTHRSALDAVLSKARRVDPALMGAPQGPAVWVAAGELDALADRWSAERSALQAEAARHARAAAELARAGADAQRTAERLAEARFRLEQAPVPAVALRAADPAPAIVVSVIEPDRVAFAAVLFLAGFGATFALGLLGLACDDRIRRARENDFARRAAPLLGQLPQLDEDQPETRRLGAGAVHEARAMIEAASQAQGARSIAILGVGPEAGATSLSVGVAVSLAAAGRTVLLVDVAGLSTGPDTDSVDDAMQRLHVIEQDELDLYHAGGAQRTGLPGVLDGKPLAHCRFETRLHNLAVLASVTQQPGDAARLSAQRLGQVLQQAEHDHSLVLIDAGTSSHGVGPLAAASAADAAVLVVKRGATQARVDQTLAKLRVAGANILGVVFNRAQAKHVHAEPADVQDAVATGQDAARGSGIFASAMADRRSLKPFPDDSLLDELDFPRTTEQSDRASFRPEVPPVDLSPVPVAAAAAVPPGDAGESRSDAAFAASDPADPAPPTPDAAESARREAQRLQREVFQELAERRAASDGQKRPASPPIPALVEADPPADAERDPDPHAELDLDHPPAPDHHLQPLAHDPSHLGPVFGPILDPDPNDLLPGDPSAVLPSATEPGVEPGLSPVMPSNRPPNDDLDRALDPWVDQQISASKPPRRDPD
ncbi:MAG: hypothetical protein AAF288_07770 [Planctomycetota bacterium]